MRSFGRFASGAAAIAAMAALILDSSTALVAAADGVELCIRTAVPSLFPFFVLSGILVPHAARFRIPALSRLLKVPERWESIFLLGCIGGYPVGAQCIAQAYRSGKLDRQNARRMLGFCTNCGPSFLFGIVGAAFSNPTAAAAITAIGILSAMLVGILWPSSPAETSAPFQIEPVTLPQAVKQGTRSMVSVCAWIILGKVILSFLNQWLLCFLPDGVNLLLSGLLELTNGCLSLEKCADESLRFILACVMTSFGGLCVAMQVSAICTDSDLDMGHYLPQKALQCLLSGAMAWSLVRSPGLIPLGIIFLLFLGKITVEIPSRMVYNGGSKGGM